MIEANVFKQILEENEGQLLLDIKDDCGVDVEFYTITKKGTEE